MKKEEELRFAKMEAALRHFRRLASQMKDRKAKTEMLLAGLKDASEAIKPLPHLQVTEGKGFSPEHLVVLLSDCQAGTEVIGSELGNKDWDYNTDVFRYRLRLYLNGIMEVVNRHRKVYSVPEIHLWLGGDLIENDQTFPSQAVWIDSNVMTQFFMVQYEVLAFIRELARRFKKVHIFTTVGNHGRVASTKANTDFVNWEYLLYRNIQWALRAHRNVKMDVPLAWWQLRNINGHGFCFVHGEDIIKNLGFPWYSQGRVHSAYVQFAQKVGQPFQYLVHGHHHIPINLATAIGELIANGSFVGYTRFTMKKLSMAGVRPMQQIFFVHPKHGISGRYWLKLDLKNEKLWQEVVASANPEPKMPIPHEEFVKLLDG